MMNKDKWITARDIITGQADDRIPMEEDGFVRMSEIRHEHDSTEKTRREANREADNKRRKKRVNKIESRWRRRWNKKGSCSQTRKTSNEVTNTERRNKVVRALEGRIAVQRGATKRKENTAEEIRMATTRWMRSDEGGGNRGRGDQEKKGKGIMEDATAKEIFTIRDDSEEDVEMFDSDGEEGEPGREWTSRMAKAGRFNVQESRKEDARGNQEREGEGAFGNPLGVKSRRGRGSYRRRGGAGGSMKHL